jgi:uncharacterized protein YqeY
MLDMSLELRINEAIKEAMRAKAEGRLRGLRDVKAQLILAKTDGSGNAIDEAREIQILQKMVKQRRDSMNLFLEQNREDLAQKEQEELVAIEEFLPQQMDAAELEALVSRIIAESGANSVKDMGRVIGLASKELAGRADNKVVAEVVKKLLS